MKFSLIMENWRKFVSEQTEPDPETHPGGYVSVADKEGKEIEGGVSVDDELQKVEKAFGDLKKNELPIG